MTLAGYLRLIGGGTNGGLVRIAWIGRPCGGPRSPGSLTTLVAGAATARPSARAPAKKVAIIEMRESFIKIPLNR